MAKQHDDEDIIEGQQLSIQQLATISDEALDNAYKYGRSTPGNSFGWQANLKSAQYAKQMIDKGVTDIEAISDAIHKGWNVTAQAFVQKPEQFDDTAKLQAAGKLEAKLQQRAELMKKNYAQLPEDEKEKDRVVARALLQALKGQQGQQGVAEDDIEESALQASFGIKKYGKKGMEKLRAAGKKHASEKTMQNIRAEYSDKEKPVKEDWSAPPQDTGGYGDSVRKTTGGNTNVYKLSQLLKDPSVESYIKMEVSNVYKPSNELIQGIKSKKWEGFDTGPSSMEGPGGWFIKATNPMYFKEFLKALSQSVTDDRQIRVSIDPYVKNAREKSNGMAEGNGDSEIHPGMKVSQGTVVKVNGNTVTVKTSNGDMMNMNIHDVDQAVTEGQDDLDTIRRLLKK
jgi:hypothetical protein